MKATGRWNNVRGTNLLDGGAHFYGSYACSDGRFISLGSIAPQFYQILLDRLGLEPAEYQPQLDAERWPELKERLAAIFRTKPRGHCTRWTSIPWRPPETSLDESVKYAHTPVISKETS